MEEVLKDVFRMDIIKPESTVICRIDINSPIKKLDNEIKIIDDTRFRGHEKTIRTLVNNSNRVILLAHQGRPGNADFVPLKAHADLLSEVLGIEIKYVDDIIGPRAIEAIEKLRSAEVLLLDNVRFLEFECKNKTPEEHAESPLVRILSKYADYFVLDGFAVSHRSHASVVGFAPVLPSAIGLLMESEILNLSYVRRKVNSYTLIFGGAKLSDAIKYIGKFLRSGKTNRILLTGLTALAFHMVRGYRIPSSTKKLIIEIAGDMIDKIRDLAKSDKIVLPIDYGVEINGDRKDIPIEELGNIDAPAKDVGPRTIEYYLDLVKDTEVVLLKGPAGVIEDEKFAWGSRVFLERLFKMNKFAMFFGGHLVSVLRKIDDSIKNGKYFVSTGGGAAVEYLIEGTLAGLEALKLSHRIFADKLR